MTPQELRDLVIGVRCVVLRYNPIRFPVGLLSSGRPDATSPVGVSGNYFRTVQRLRKTLRGIDCHILVADSAGINVWCAAGVCDFNEHKIADAVHATGLATVVSHRRLILPQLAAVGVDLARLRAESGFSGTWGPARLEDLPVLLRGDGRVAGAMRLVRFPLADRFHNAVGLFDVFLLLPLALLIFLGTGAAAFALLANALVIFPLFLGYPLFPCRYPANSALIWGLVVTAAVALGGLALAPGSATVWVSVGTTLLAALLVAIDMLGSTPFYKTTIAHWLATGDNRSLFQPLVLDRCTGCGACEAVCPKGIFSLGTADGRGRRAVANLDAECCECLACLKQCPREAIANVHGALFKDDIKSVPDVARLVLGEPQAPPHRAIAREEPE
ncbi:MAG: 4Fe-4S binding protein [Candidatus Riflebacteria bacterium]|nr:4Fe-4S binding protein [Candidatus Riflebacteria bacterium]